MAGNITVPIVPVNKKYKNIIELTAHDRNDIFIIYFYNIFITNYK